MSRPDFGLLGQGHRTFPRVTPQAIDPKSSAAVLRIGHWGSGLSCMKRTQHCRKQKDPSHPPTQPWGNGYSSSGHQAKLIQEGLLEEEGFKELPLQQSSTAWASGLLVSQFPA